MRLIDADAIQHTEYLNGHVTVSKEKINKMPTVFELEKVIEQLEEEGFGHAINAQQYGEDGYYTHEHEEKKIEEGIGIDYEIIKSAMNDKIGG